MRIIMLQNTTNNNPSVDTESSEASNNDNTQSLESPMVGENQANYYTKSSVEENIANRLKLNISQEKALAILAQCENQIANSWISTQTILTAEVAQFYETSKQEVIAASNKYSGELESQVSFQFSPRDILHIGMFLNSSTATIMRSTLLDYVEAWGKESKRERVIKLLENENIKNWSDSAIARIANCSRTYVGKIRDDKPGESQVKRGENVIQMKRKKKEEVDQKPQQEEKPNLLEPNNQGPSPYHATSCMIQDVVHGQKDKGSSLTSEPGKPKSIKRTWAQGEYEEAIARIEADHRMELLALERQVTERIGSEFERERLKEIEDEKESYKGQLEIALNRIDALQQSNSEVEELKATNRRLSEQIDRLGEELQKKQVVSSQETITKKAEELMREEFKKRFGDIDPELHLQALAVQSPQVESPQQKAFLKRILVSALASVALLFPDSNIEKAAATALNVEPEKIEATAKHLNRVGEGVTAIRSAIIKVGCTKEEFDKSVEPYLNIKKHIWAELSDIDKNRIKEILNKTVQDNSSTINPEETSFIADDQPTPDFPNPWSESKTWQYQNRVAKYDAESKALSWGAQLKKIDLSTVCKEWESPQAWLMNYASPEVKKSFKVGDKVLISDRDNRYFEQTGIVEEVDGDWYKCAVAGYYAEFHKDELTIL